MEGRNKMITLDNSQWNQLDEMILNLHIQKDVTALHTQILERLAVLIPHRRSFFDLCTTQNGQRVFFAPVSLGTTSRTQLLRMVYEKMSIAAALPEEPLDLDK